MAETGWWFTGGMKVRKYEAIGATKVYIT